MDVHCRMYIHRMGSLINIFCYIAPDREREREWSPVISISDTSPPQSGSVSQIIQDPGRTGIVVIFYLGSSCLFKVWVLN